MEYMDNFKVVSQAMKDDRFGETFAADKLSFIRNSLDKKKDESEKSEKISKTSFWKTPAKVPGTVTAQVVQTEAKGKSSSPTIDGLKNSSHQERTENEIQTPAPESTVPSTKDAETPERSIRIQKYQKILDQNVIDLEALRKLSWGGVPPKLRPLVWKLLLEYLPSNKERQSSILEKKRQEYLEFVPKYYEIPENERTAEEKALFRQIQIDVPRTFPEITLFQQTTTQQLLARVLYIWAIRHPASGYVQGINDLASPFFVVFLTEHYFGDWTTCPIDELPIEVRQEIECDTYWCLTKLLDGIQDNYTFAQPGIQRMVHKLGELVHRIDAPLHKHLKAEGVHFLDFSFSWMNCLLLRELSFPMACRLWDTYFVELNNLSIFHVYACLAFLARFSKELQATDFQGVLLFLKKPPTAQWSTQEVDLLLSQAYMWKTLFEDSPRHLQ